MTAPDRAAAGGGDEWFTYVIIGVGGLVGSLWAGAQLASLVWSQQSLPVTLGDALQAGIQLPETMGDPAAAWPLEVQAQLPGPWLYWPATMVVLVALVVLGALVVRSFGSTKLGTQRPKRLGVEPSARFARNRDLAPIIVKGPTRGRFILGRVGRHLVATEDRSTQPEMTGRQRVRRRVGDRSAVAVVGPTRCGKTATVTAGALDWDTAAILSSVKPDLYLDTIEHRRRLGEVFVFDPFGELDDDLGDGVTRVAWSPLQSAHTVSGAQQAAATLLDAAPVEGVTNANYWATKGMQLLWPVLYAAATSGRTMGDVARWMALQDGDDSEGGEVHERLAELATTDGPASLEAQQALTAFTGFWKLDTRTRSDIFSTAQTLIAAWDDPYIAAASAMRVNTGSGEIVRPAMSLDRLLTGNNTLYVIQPLGTASRFAVVFGGLLGDLLRDQAYEISRRAGRPIPPLLAVIDEAGNTPLRWLPHVASTCSGIGVQLVTVWQSLAQMRAIYQAQTDSLLTNHATKVFFSGISDDLTLRYVSDMCGEEEVPTHSATTDVHGSGRRRSIAASTARTRLVPVDLLRQAPEGTALLLHGRLPPAHLVGRRPREERRLRELMNGNGRVPESEELDEAMRKALERSRQLPAFVEAHLKEVRSRADERAKALEKEEQQDKPPEVNEPKGNEGEENELQVAATDDCEKMEDVPPDPNEADGTEENGDETRHVASGVELAQTLTIERAADDMGREPDPETDEVLGLMGRLRPERSSGIQM